MRIFERPRDEHGYIGGYDAVRRFDRINEPARRKRRKRGQVQLLTRYHAFERVIQETLKKRPMRILSYCLMRNHWHFVGWPENDGELARFMQCLTVTHVTRWQKRYNMIGHGHVYQGRFKSSPVETDEYFYKVNRYVERNAMRAKLVERAEDWPWCSLWIHKYGTAEHRAMISNWPLPRPRKWLQYANEPETEAELLALRRSCL